MLQMRRVVLAVVMTSALAGCGSSSPHSRSAASVSVVLPPGVSVALPPKLAIGPTDKLSPQQLAEFKRGRVDVVQSGCLACHRIGVSGNLGPGPNLNEIAGRLPRRAIEETLIQPVAPMPSYKHLSRSEFHAIVTFLSALR